MRRLAAFLKVHQEVEVVEEVTVVAAVVSSENTIKMRRASL